MTSAQRVSTQFALKNKNKALLTGFKVILQIRVALHRFLQLLQEVSAYESQTSESHLMNVTPAPLKMNQKNEVVSAGGILRNRGTNLTMRVVSVGINPTGV